MISETERWAPPDRKTGLLIRNRLLQAFLLGRDYLFKEHDQRTVSHLVSAKSVLFCLGGHLGDALNALYIIRAFRKSYPSVKINLLAARWMSPILNEYREGFDEIFWLDPWASNRSSKTWLRKIGRNVSDFLRSFIQISELRPDVAFDLYYYWPNSALLLRFLNIPISIGFGSGGGERLYKYPLRWGNWPISVAEYMAEILKNGGFPVQLSKEKIWTREDFSVTWSRLLNKWPKLKEKYVLIHPGTGARLKEWSKENWEKLIIHPIFDGIPLVFTGSGPRESTVCFELSQSRGNILNLCGYLNFHEYLVVVANAVHAIGLDSLCGHLAAATGVPCTLIHPGITVEEHWRPWASGADVIRYNVPCAPCHRSHGCEGMECMTLITPGHVVERLKQNPMFSSLQFKNRDV